MFFDRFVCEPGKVAKVINADPSAVCSTKFFFDPRNDPPCGTFAPSGDRGNVLYIDHDACWHRNHNDRFFIVLKIPAKPGLSENLFYGKII